MAVLKHRGQNYLIVGGAGDCIPVFVLMLGEKMAARAQIADKTPM